MVSFLIMNLSENLYNSCGFCSSESVDIKDEPWVRLLKCKDCGSETKIILPDKAAGNYFFRYEIK